MPKNSSEIEKHVNSVQAAINKAFEESCPLKASRQPGEATKWWNQALSDLKKKARKSFNKAKITKLQSDWEQYKNNLREFKKLVRQRQREAWRAYCEEIEDYSQAARLCKILAKDKDHDLGLLKKDDGTRTTDLRESLELLMQTHFPESVMTEEEEWPNEVDTQPLDLDWQIANRIVSEDRIRWAIQSFSPFKSPGIDGIYPALLQWGLDELLPHLVGILRSCLAHLYVPKVWREVKVLFIPKAGRIDYTTPKAYRPISLTSFLLKTMEKLCERYLRDVAMTNNPAHLNQHAYTPGRSTDTALHMVASRIEKSLDNKESTLGVFIDIEGAFDKTTFSKITTALTSRDVPRIVDGWISNMLSKRIVRINVGSTRIRGTVARGCPQGGVLSPLLWNLVLDSLLRHLNSEGFYTIAYADDLTILLSGKFEGVLCDRMQMALKLIEKWCREHDLSVNPRKTEMVLFTRKRKLEPIKAPVLLNTTLNFASEVKYLGVTFDAKLTWNLHLERRLKKAYISYEQCRRTMGKTWGIKPKVVMWLYTAIIRPMITYGAIAWWPKSQQTIAKLKLSQIQRVACLSITGAMRTTPTRAMEVMLCLPPLDLHLVEVAQTTMARLKSVGVQPNVGCGEVRSRLWGESIKKIPLLQARADSIFPRFVFDRPYAIHTETGTETAGEGVINIFTDGSKNEGGAGCGIYSRSLRIQNKWTMDKHASITQTELAGITIAAKEIARRHIRGKTIRFYTDSRQALLALQSHKIATGSVWECHQALADVSLMNIISLCWVKGHAQCSGNKKADKLAKKAANLNIMGPGPSSVLPMTVIIQSIKENTHQEFRKRWDETGSCQWAREFLQYPSKQTAMKYLTMTRRNLRLATGILTGHCQLRKHLHTMKLSDTPLCRGCEQEDETVQHVLCDCPAISSMRESILGERWPTMANLREIPLGDIITYFIKLGWLMA